VKDQDLLIQTISELVAQAEEMNFQISCHSAEIITVNGTFSDLKALQLAINCQSNGSAVILE